MNVKNMDAVLFANVDFNGSVLGHIYLRVVKQILSPGKKSAVGHYTMRRGMAGK